MIKGTAVGTGKILPHHSTFVPTTSAVVSSAVVAEVFEDQTVPFTLNSDGSVDRGVYVKWLNDVGAQALAAFAECSAPAKAKRRVLA